MSRRASRGARACTDRRGPGDTRGRHDGCPQGVRLPASVSAFAFAFAFADRIVSLTREIAPFLPVTDSLPLKRAEGRLPQSPPTEPVVASTQVGTRAEAVSRGREFRSAAQLRVLAWRCPTRRRVGNQDVERQGCWTMKGLRWLRAVEAGGGITGIPNSGVG